MIVTWLSLGHSLNVAPDDSLDTEEEQQHDTKSQKKLIIDKQDSEKYDFRGKKSKIVSILFFETELFRS